MEKERQRSRWRVDTESGRALNRGAGRLPHGFVIVVPQRTRSRMLKGDSAHLDDRDDVGVVRHVTLQLGGMGGERRHEFLDRVEYEVTQGGEWRRRTGLG